MKRIVWLLAVVGAVLLSLTPSLAYGEFYVIGGGGGVGTKITSLPYTITDSGFYYLGRDLTSTGNGITVNASDVTIDLMGFKITGPGTTNSYGIYMYAQANVQVRNGTVRNFNYGVYAGETSDTQHSIIGIRAIGNKGATSAGIRLAGGSHIIKNCIASYNAGDGIVTDGALISDCICEINGGLGIWTAGSVTGCSVNANKKGGIVAGNAPGNVIKNTCYNNTGYGFDLGDKPLVVDQNSAFGNTLANYNGSYPATQWGLNAGK